MSKNPQWKWFGNNGTIVEDSGRRNVIILPRNGSLLTRAENGTLEPLTPDHSVAQLIISAPELKAENERLRTENAALLDRCGKLENEIIGLLNEEAYLEDHECQP